MQLNTSKIFRITYSAPTLEEFRTVRRLKQTLKRAGFQFIQRSNQKTGKINGLVMIDLEFEDLTSDQIWNVQRAINFYFPPAD